MPSANLATSVAASACFGEYLYHVTQRVAVDEVADDVAFVSIDMHLVNLNDVRMAKSCRGLSLAQKALSSLAD